MGWVLARLYEIQADLLSLGVDRPRQRRRPDVSVKVCKGPYPLNSWLDIFVTFIDAR